MAQFDMHDSKIVNVTIVFKHILHTAVSKNLRPLVKNVSILVLIIVIYYYYYRPFHHHHITTRKLKGQIEN